MSELLVLRELLLPPEMKDFSSPSPLVAPADSDVSSGSESDTDSQSSSNSSFHDAGSAPSNDEGVNKKRDEATGSRSSSRASRTAASAFHGTLHAAAWVGLALYLPFLVTPNNDAVEIYRKASYDYDTEWSHFDNTAWTYGTDYALAAIMTGLACWIHLSGKNESGAATAASHPSIDRLRRLSSSLFVLYAVSTLTGGLAHQHFLTVESRNTAAFRFLWTMCVGTVCIATISMGMIGNECFRLFRGSVAAKGIPIVSDAFWVAYGISVAAVCLLGGISYQRPACDICVAGVFQTPSTFYLMAFLFAVRHPKVELAATTAGLVGFIMNAPLLPMYPALVLRSGWSLASVNAFLHAWLSAAWSTQGVTLQHVICALAGDCDKSRWPRKEQKERRRQRSHHQRKKVR